MKRFLFILLFLFTFNSAQAKHLYPEADYQNAWCSKNGGILEYKNPDETRVDCLTKTHAVEFDFAKKWAESVGQAEHYALMTGKTGKVILIIETPKDFKYLERVKKLAKKHHFDVEYVTPEIIVNHGQMVVNK